MKREKCLFLLFFILFVGVCAFFCQNIWLCRKKAVILQPKFVTDVFTKQLTDILTHNYNIMKKSILMMAVMVTLGVTAAVAQPRAIGGQIGYGIEASYEHTLGNNFVTVDLGLPGLLLHGFFGVEGVATYNWLNPFGADFPSVSQGDWNWYMGVGAGVGGVFYHDRSTNNWFNTGYVGVAGRIGVEYNFWFPLQLSAEWRPVVGPGFGYNWYKAESSAHFYADGLYGLLIGVRYKF